MKKLYFTFIMVVVITVMLQGCGATAATKNSSFPSNSLVISASDRKITEELAYKGIYHYCRSVYDWSITEENSDIMYLEMGEETESEYQLIFRSYTGTFVYFYVDKSSGITKITEYVPNLEIKEDSGTIDLYDYLE